MTQINIEPGIYTNIFRVSVPDQPVRFLTASRDSFQNLYELREYIQERGWNTQVYAPPDSNTVYSYGPDMRYLAGKSFSEESVCLPEHPHLTSRLIREGILNLLRGNSYQVQFGKGRATAFRINEFTPAAGGRVRVYRGYDLNSIFWWDSSLGKLSFGVVVDVTWAMKDQQGQPLSMQRVAAYGATAEIAQIQGEFLPGGTRINTEVARQRFQEHILPFIQQYDEFELPCGVAAKMLPQPIRVIIGGLEV